MSREEQEITIRWDNEEKTAHIWTCDPVQIRRLDKLTMECADLYKCTEETAWLGNPAKSYIVPSKYIRFGKPKKMNLSEDQRRAIAERLKRKSVDGQICLE